MSDPPPDIRLDHVNLPALKPEWLAEWYAENFGFKAKGGFVFAPGTLLVFEPGQPLDYRGNTHFGFRCSSKEKVAAWARRFRAELETDATYCGFKTKDPEGNIFEVYWEQ
jgi:catechol-2,3-dioxygenase